VAEEFEKKAAAIESPTLPAPPAADMWSNSNSKLSPIMTKRSTYRPSPLMIDHSRLGVTVSVRLVRYRLVSKIDRHSRSRVQTRLEVDFCILAQSLKNKRR
jgi:hypothetical protein